MVSSGSINACDKAITAPLFPLLFISTSTTMVQTQPLKMEDEASVNRQLKIKVDATKR